MSGTADSRTLICTSGTIFCTSASSAAERPLEGNRVHVALIEYVGLVAFTSIRLRPAVAAFTSIWNDSGTCSNVTSTWLVVLSAFGTAQVKDIHGCCIDTQNFRS